MQQLSPVALFAGVVLVIAALFAGQSFVTVDSGTVGVVKRFGAVSDLVLQPGLHFKAPMITEIVPVETRVKKVQQEASASSKDLQVIKSIIALNYRIEPEKASKIYQDLGPEFEERIVEPALQEAIKATTAKYTAEELVTKRADVALVMEEDLKVRLAMRDIVPTDLNIIDFQFSPEFNDAIEQKQIAQQAAQRARNELERVKLEAEQEEAKAQGVALATLAKAKAEAEGQKLLRETVTPELLQLRALEKWNGILPVYTGGGAPLPFIGVPSPQPQQ
jgi:regulator of protease activity HflC (stomatin/prohibitin superfamily)